MKIEKLESLLISSVFGLVISSQAFGVDDSISFSVRKIGTANGAMDAGYNGAADDADRRERQEIIKQQAKEIMNEAQARTSTQDWLNATRDMDSFIKSKYCQNVELAKEFKKLIDSEEFLEKMSDLGKDARNTNRAIRSLTYLYIFFVSPLVQVIDAEVADLKTTERSPNLGITKREWLELRTQFALDPYAVMTFFSDGYILKKGHAPPLVWKSLKENYSLVVKSRSSKFISFLKKISTPEQISTFWLLDRISGYDLSEFSDLKTRLTSSGIYESDLSVAGLDPAKVLLPKSLLCKTVLK